ncbi:hypothetical protein LTR53_015862 [Teratosphaeriaceae sp. CCFEE 6253]|nr:hypothetical protein LTR53_015862 [Teratosphaeriaceae sp. CCFEE 6253]
MATPNEDYSSRKGSDPSDTASLATTSSTTSTTQLLKSVFLPRRKPRSSSAAKDDQLSAGEKQAARRAGRVNVETLATIAALR